MRKMLLVGFLFMNLKLCHVTQDGESNTNSENYRYTSLYDFLALSGLPKSSWKYLT